jgi:phospholipase/carboxylesterase
MLFSRYRNTLMNRLTHSPAIKPWPTSNADQRGFDVAGMGQSPDKSPAVESVFAYHLLGPIHYEPNYAYPLVVWLHNAGDDEKQLFKVMPHVSLRNYVAVGPRGVVAEESGYSYSWSPELASVTSAWHRVQESIALARKQYNVNPQRIFLAGLQDGGTMALRLALTQPEYFAGAVSVGGAFPINCGALSRLSAIRQLPLLIARGMESVDYPETRVCEEIRLFHAARMQVHLRQYLCGDELITPMLRDMDAWLMEQVTGMPVLTENDASAASSGS